MRIGILTEEIDNEDVALALKDAGEKLGAEIVIFNPTECAVINSAQPQILNKGEPLPKLDVCLFRGAEKNLEFKLYVVEYLSKLGTKMINTAKSIRLCNNKFETQTLLNNVEIKTPNTVSILQIEQLEHAVKVLDNKFPMVVKTVSGSHGVGVIKVDTFESLKSIVQLLLAREIELMLQEFIKHDKSGRIMTIGDKVVASVMRSIPEGDFRSNLDQGAELSPYQATPEEGEVALKVAKTLECDICAIDYITNENGDMVIFEANSSPGLKGIQSVNGGVNIAEEIVKFAIASIPQSTDIEDDTEYEEEEEVIDGVKVKKKKKKKINTVGYIAIPVVQKAPDDCTQHHTTDNTSTVETPSDAVPVAPTDTSTDASGEEEEEEVTEPSDEIGLDEKIIIKRINNNEPFSAKIDTGATCCSLGATDIEQGDNFVRFKIDDVTYKVPLERTVGVRAANGRSERPIVKFDVVFNDQTYEGIEFNITDRASMKYQVLIGTNLLEITKVVINPNV